MFHDGDNPLRRIGTGYSGGVITVRKNKIFNRIYIIKNRDSDFSLNPGF